MDLLTTSSPGGFPTLSLTTNSSWLPWGGGCHASHQPSDASTPEHISSINKINQSRQCIHTVAWTTGRAGRKVPVGVVCAQWNAFKVNKEKYCTYSCYSYHSSVEGIVAKGGAVFIRLIHI